MTRANELEEQERLRREAHQRLAAANALSDLIAEWRERWGANREKECEPGQPKKDRP